MPPPRKIDLLPAELRGWLQEELRASGFAGYEDLAERLNFRLEEEGLELRIRKSAIHAYGVEYEAMVRAQEEASAWAVGWMQDEGLADEAKRHSVLFQMITTLAFKVMKSQALKEGDQIDPKELHFLGKMLKDVMSSSGIREQTIAADRKAQAARLDAAAASGEVDEDFRRKAREIMGFS
ncbi:MAG TPA: hypothetical protein DEF16_01985 [Gemmobacter sp.]|nr:hypothetical protein [Gemmobacter sp.]HBU13750.1 hypothetical protein [Gemmobacter sp.]